MKVVAAQAARCRSSKEEEKNCGATANRIKQTKKNLGATRVKKPDKRRQLLGLMNCPRVKSAGDSTAATCKRTEHEKAI